MRSFSIIIFLLINFSFISGQEQSSVSTDSTEITVQKDSVSQVDSTSIDSAAAAVKKRTVRAVYFSPSGTSPSYFISRAELRYNDYRFSGDYLNRFPLAFTADLGYMGSPNEVMVYGEGFNNVSYFKDGQLLNNRLNNSFDLNNIQSEGIDSIEIIRMPRGFLYGIFNNTVSVNFIARQEFLPQSDKRPYTSFRYYQAPNEEALVNLIYNSYLSRRFIVNAEFTNRKIDSLFVNSGHDAWLANASIKYLLNNKTNLLFSYGYAKSHTKLNGGLDRDSLLRMAEFSQESFYDIIDDAISDPGSAPVNSQRNYRNIIEHSFLLQLVGRSSDNSSGRLSFYHKNSGMEYNQYINGTRNRSDDDYKVYGASIEGTLKLAGSDLGMNAGYEYIDSKAPILSDKVSQGSGFVSGIYSLGLMNNAIITSVYGKYLNANAKNYLGAGVDISYRMNSKISLYAGISRFRRPAVVDGYIYSSVVDNYGNAAEASIAYSTENVNTGLNLFYTKNNSGIMTINGIDSIPAIEPLNGSTATFGAGIPLKLQYGWLLIDTRSAFYMKENTYTNGVMAVNGERIYSMPEFTFRGGVYYTGMLFNSNLNLKAGLGIRAVGMQSEYYYDQRTDRRVSIVNNSINAEPTYVLDLTAIGEIRRKAVLYFTIENLLDRGYYIVPYYPMPGRSLKFGLSWEFIN